MEIENIPPVGGVPLQKGTFHFRQPYIPLAGVVWRTHMSFPTWKV
jgi:hypothetical protein